MNPASMYFCIICFCIVLNFGLLSGFRLDCTEPLVTFSGFHLRANPETLHTGQTKTRKGFSIPKIGREGVCVPRLMIFCHLMALFNSFSDVCYKTSLGQNAPWSSDHGAFWPRAEGPTLPPSLRPTALHNHGCYIRGGAKGL